MNRPRSAWQRPFLWMLVVALVVLAATSVTRILALRSELQTQVTQQVAGQVGETVESWETQLLENLDQWLEELAVDPTEAGHFAGQLERREPWFDSAYLWVPAPRIPADLPTPPKLMRGTLLYPTYPAAEETRRILMDPCLGRAKALSIFSGADPVEMARLYIQGCTHEPMQVRLVAATEAATLLHRAGHDKEALQALDSTRLPPDLPIAEGIAKGLPPFRLVVHRTQRAQLLLALGRVKAALDLLYQTGTQVAGLDAPQANGLLPFVRWPIIADLEQNGRHQQAIRLQTALARAERRARAWHEVDEKLLPQSQSEISENGRFVHDQYGNPPFLLYYKLVRKGEYGAAAALDQPTLLQDFLHQLPNLADDLVITDAEGHWVAGDRSNSAIAVQVPFTRTLTHLRVGVRVGSIRSGVLAYGNQWVTPLVVTIVFVLVGLGGVISQMRAINRQYELMARQREFTTRVTHELKTPLAGIRVMAENLQAGAFRDEGHRRDMARRITDEADRLTARVDEILAVGRARRMPEPTEFDPEEPLLEAIDTWGPRLETAGVKLVADLHPTDTLMGDPEAIRDAVGCLLDNALKYHDEAKAEPKVWLTLHQDGQNLVIDVADDGIGVPADLRASIFERFVRVEGPNRGRAGGHGLGLSQVAEIAAMHGGSVRCTEGEDGGARFTLRLPANK